MTNFTNNRLKSQTDLLTEVSDVQDISNQSAASIQGGVAILYDLKNQKRWLGEYQCCDKEFSSTADNDVSSVNITTGTWDFFSGKDYTGRKLRLSVGKYNLADFNFDQTMSSLKRVA